VALASVSLMLCLRLGAAGAPGKTILRLLVLLWGSLGLAVAVLASLSGILGQPAGTDLPEEIMDFGARWQGLDLRAKYLFSVGLAAAVVLFAGALFTIRRALQDYPVD